MTILNLVRDNRADLEDSRPLTRFGYEQQEFDAAVRRFKAIPSDINAENLRHASGFYQLFVQKTRRS